jgi:two-component system, OmpR family, sensor kinase
MIGQWRPSLGLVLGGALMGTLGLSLAGLVALRYLGPVIGFRSAAILLALAITAATAFLGWLLLRLILRPVRDLEVFARAQEVSLHVAPPIHFGTRETAATARRVIAMAEALRDREATIRAFADHVTHELKTPVSVIFAAAELLGDSKTLAAEDRRLLGEIDGARVQLETQLAALHRATKAREARFLGQSRLSHLVPALAADFPNLDLRSEGDSLPLPISAEGMLVVLSQLIRNAAEHGAATVILRAQAEAGQTILDIVNDGDRISAGNAAQIFQPFFTTRRASGGTGMGLTVVRNLLAAHHADIILFPAQAATTFRISFSPDMIVM